MVYVLTYVQTCCGGGCEKSVAISIEMFTAVKHEDMKALSGICCICVSVLQYIKPLIIFPTFVIDKTRF